MDRPAAIARLRRGPIWDVLVIGGGATGLAAALDAAARGYATALLERGDFACATSSRSTKLVHGGVRYLRQGRTGLVRSALRERTLLLRNAPALVRSRAFVVPVYSAWEKLFYGAGLALYDVLARGHQPESSRILSCAETLAVLPTLRPDRLAGGVRYTDGQFDDAGLALAFAQAAARHGAAVVNYVPVTALLKAGDRVAGAVARDEESGETFEVRARAVINATGVFADEVRRLDEPATPPTLAPSQGAHVVLPRDFLPGDTALMIPKTADGRVLFAIPWHGRVLLGTTDTPVNEVAREPAPLAEEISYLLEHAGRYLDRTPARADVLSMFAGLRPLVKGRSGPTSALSRDHLIDVAASGLVTIAGGKWTTARHMAEDVVDRAAAIAGLPPQPCRTAPLALEPALPRRPKLRRTIWSATPRARPWRERSRTCSPAAPACFTSTRGPPPPPLPASRRFWPRNSGGMPAGSRRRSRRSRRSPRGTCREAAGRPGVCRHRSGPAGLERLKAP
ncbi:MAG TPA: glycerol-3-phosphate dehydrogenase/oxidase [Opitutaceae bacterium]|nr:glycerol-3-phosphate dehydrogenase/oxidase [Opitutaceae bacterium]